MRKRLYLKPGVTPEQALERLRPLLIEAGNVRAERDQTTAYLRWANHVETQLSAHSRDPELGTVLLTNRYWQMLRSPPTGELALTSVNAELDLQIRALGDLIIDLEERIAAADAGPGDIVVLDTNVLLHSMPPDQIPWPQELGREQIRLVVPLRVVEELDAKKWSGSGVIGERARRLLPMLERLVGDSGQPGRVRENTTIEVPVNRLGLTRFQDADAEVLATSNELVQLTGRPAILVTADTGMRLRARAQGLTAIRLAEKYDRSRG